HLFGYLLDEIFKFGYALLQRLNTLFAQYVTSLLGGFSILNLPTPAGGDHVARSSLVRMARGHQPRRGIWPRRDHGMGRGRKRCAVRASPFWHAAATGFHSASRSSED